MNVRNNVVRWGILQYLSINCSQSVKFMGIVQVFRFIALRPFRDRPSLDRAWCSGSSWPPWLAFMLNDSIVSTLEKCLTIVWERMINSLLVKRFWIEFKNCLEFNHPHKILPSFFAKNECLFIWRIEGYELNRKRGVYVQVRKTMLVDDMTKFLLSVTVILKFVSRYKKSAHRLKFLILNFKENAMRFLDFWL